MVARFCCAKHATPTLIPVRPITIGLFWSGSCNTIVAWTHWWSMRKALDVLDLHHRNNYFVDMETEIQMVYLNYVDWVHHKCYQDTRHELTWCTGNIACQIDIVRPESLLVSICRWNKCSQYTLHLWKALKDWIDCFSMVSVWQDIIMSWRIAE